MGAGETARLLAEFIGKDSMTPAIGKMTKSLDKLDKHVDSSQTRAFKAGQQIGTGIKAGVIVATGAIAAIGGLLLASAKEGQAAQTVQLKFNKAVENSGKVSADYIAILAARIEELQARHDI